MSSQIMGKLYTCSVCGKTYQYKHTLQRHAKTKHGKSDDSKYECYMCDKTFNRKNILNIHLKMEHGVVMRDYEYSDDDDNATSPPMQRASVDLNDLTDIRAHEEIATPSYSKWNKHPYHLFKGAHSSRRNRPYQFKHPFSMMVAGPSRSGKTYWVARLLMRKINVFTPLPTALSTVTVTGKSCTTRCACTTLVYVGNRGCQMQYWWKSWRIPL